MASTSATAGVAGGAVGEQPENSRRSTHTTKAPPQSISASPPMNRTASRACPLPNAPPLAEWGLSESDCLAYCRERGFRWLQASPAAEGGYNDLYDILDRVSCWCCANKNRRELKNIYTYLPDYWARLKALQSKLERPMKRYTNKMYGAYGRVEQLEEVFKGEAEI